MIPGNGVSGVVSSIASGTDESWLGRRVISTTGGSGGYAERVAVDASLLVGVPSGVGLDTAVAALTTGRTATMLMETVGVVPGERVLVEAAGGGVGSMLVQLAAAAGATVIGVAGDPRKLDLARQLGAKVVVNYREPDWTNQVRDAVGGVDVVLDGVGGDVARSAFELIDSGGRMLSFGLASGVWADLPVDLAASRGVTLLRGSRPTPEKMRSHIEGALAEVAAGRLRAVIGERYPLAHAGEAHAVIESRATVGALLMAPGSSNRPARASP